MSSKIQLSETGRDRLQKLVAEMIDKKLPYPPVNQFAPLANAEIGRNQSAPRLAEIFGIVAKGEDKSAETKVKNALSLLSTADFAPMAEVMLSKIAAHPISVTVKENGEHGPAWIDVRPASREAKSPADVLAHFGLVENQIVADQLDNVVAALTERLPKSSTPTKLIGVQLPNGTYDWLYCQDSPNGDGKTFFWAARLADFDHAPEDIRRQFADALNKEETPAS